MRIGQGLLLDAIAAVPADVGQCERRHACSQPANAGVSVTLLLGEVCAAVRDDQSQVAHAGLVDPRVIDLVESAVAEREPDVAVVAQRRAHADLCAGRPAGGNARRPGRETDRLVRYTHGHDSPGAIAGNPQRQTIAPEQGNVGALPRIGRPSVGQSGTRYIWAGDYTAQGMPAVLQRDGTVVSSLEAYAVTG